MGLLVSLISSSINQKGGICLGNKEGGGVHLGLAGRREAGCIGNKRDGGVHLALALAVGKQGQWPSTAETSRTLNIAYCFIALL